MSRLLEVADLCSRTVSDPANRLRKTRKKKSSAVPLISKRSHVGNLRQTLQGKRGDSQEGGKPQVVYPLVRPRGVSAISLASQAAKCDSCFVQSAQSTTPSGGAAMPKACFSSNYSVSQPVPPAGKFSFYGIIVPQFFRRFLHKMMKDFLRQHRTIKAAALCGNFMS